MALTNKAVESMALRELLEERNSALEQSRATLDAVARDKRERLSADEETAYQALDARFEECDAEIEARKKTDGLKSKVAEREARMSESQGLIVGRPRVSEGEQRPGNYRSTPEYAKHFDFYLRTGDERGLAEFRALQMDQDTKGGYPIPQQMVQTLLQELDDEVIIRPLASKFTVERAESLGIPTLSADPDDADWTTEIGTGSEDSAMAFGKRELYPHPMAKLLKVSKKLMRTTPTNTEALVRSRLGYKAAITEEKAFLTGSGSNQALGVFTASDAGIPTSRDVSTGNTATSMTTDNLITVQGTMKTGYLRRARWIFHREGVTQIRLLKDGNGEYIFRTGLTEGVPNTILGLPYLLSEYAPHVFTASQYVGILGDFSYYWIADALNMEIQRLDELYAEANQVGFILRKETDGMPILSSAFVRVKLAAA